MDEITRNAAIDAYRRGDLEGAGNMINLPPIAIKYGYPFDESIQSYMSRLQQALGIPDWVPLPVDPGGAGPAAAEKAPEPEPEPEDVPEPEDDSDHPEHHGRHRRRR